MKIKICGLKRPEDIEYVNKVMPDYAGFVFAGSKRRVSPQQAAELRKLLDSKITAVGVFVDEPVESVMALVKAGTIDVVQLHGHEESEYVDELRKCISVPIIKAVRTESAADIFREQKLDVDYLLVDNGPGGTGQAFDWNILKEIGKSQIYRCADTEIGKSQLDTHQQVGADNENLIYKPVFLAGGLNPGNVGEALESILPFKPFAVDVSSGVESDGYKDEVKIIDFVEAVRKSCSE